MININMTLSQQAEFAMPVSGSGLVAAVRVLPGTTPASGYSHITDVAVLKGTFPGTSAWSPPI